MRDQCVCISRGSSAPVRYQKDTIDVQTGRTGELHTQFNSAPQHKYKQFCRLSHVMPHQ